MTQQEAEELDSGDLYHQYNKQDECWLIIGTNSAFQYQDFDREDDAKQYIEDMSLDVDEDLIGYTDDEYK